METVPSPRQRRRLTVTVKDSLRDLGIQLSLLNHQVGGRVEMKGTDLECLGLIDQHGPLSPGDLSRLSGLHPATLTGVLDRLERGGWIARERSPADRRSVLIRALPDRAGEMFRHYSGMNAALDEICAGYTYAELELIAEFVRRTAAAARAATGKLGSD